MTVTYKKDGIVIENTFIALPTIVENCTKARTEAKDLTFLYLSEPWCGIKETSTDEIDNTPKEEIEIFKNATKNL